MNRFAIFLLLVIFSCQSPETHKEEPSRLFPAVREKASTVPEKDKFYIFILAGQSNMAGRGLVEPQDTVSSPQVLALDSANEWVYAKEPLHPYEPQRTGLDCGLSFGKKLLSLYGDDITIGLVPCAIGGSSIEQWLGDSTYRNVSLYSNLMKKADIASRLGVIKGILWHQGETNATTRGYKEYRQKLESFFTKLREDLGQPELPIYAGQLSSFLSRKENPFADSVNHDLEVLATTVPNMYVIPTADLTPKPDSIHFDAASQRELGARFANSVFKNK